MIEYEEFLGRYALWPLETWNQFTIVHQLPVNRAEEKEQFRRLRENVGDRNGLYVYKLDNSTIYVGKGKPIFDRLKIHFQSSYRPVNGDTKDKRWHRFFSANRGDLMVFWKEIEQEPDRQIFKIALTKLLKPTFDQFR